MFNGIPSIATLRAFVAVARLGGFSRASQSLNVSTGAVSHQIRWLEDDLGVQLFLRSQKAGMAGTVLTPDGADLLEQIEEPLTLLSLAFAKRRSKGRPPREIVISANGTVSSLWLAPRLTEFHARRPDLQCSLYTVESCPSLEDAGVHLAIQRGSRGAIRSEDQWLFHDLVFPVCNPKIKFNSWMKGEVEYALLEEDHGDVAELSWTLWLKLLGLEGRLSQRIVKFSTFNALVAAAIAGAGIALGRSPLIEAELQSGRLLQLPVGQARRAPSGYFIRRHRDGDNIPGAADLATFLLESARQSRR